MGKYNVSAKRRARLEEIIQDYLIKSVGNGELKRCDRMVRDGILTFRVNGIIDPAVMAYYIDSELRRMKFRRL